MLRGVYSFRISVQVVMNMNDEKIEIMRGKKNCVLFVANLHSFTGSVLLFKEKICIQIYSFRSDDYSCLPSNEMYSILSLRTFISYSSNASDSRAICVFFLSLHSK